MKRSGTVTRINEKRGMVAILTEDDGYTVVELTGDLELSVGDEVSWSDGYALGSEVYRNLSTEERGEVYVQNHSVSLALLGSQLLLSS